MPVEQRPRAAEARAIIIALIAVAVAIGLMFAVSVWGRRDTGSGGFQLGDDVFGAGEVERISEEIADRGPVLYSDVAGGERDIYLVHLGDDPDVGWHAFAAQQPGSDRGCFLEWDGGEDRFVDPCTGETFLADGTGLPQYVVIIEDDEIVVDINDIRNNADGETGGDG